MPSQINVVYFMNRINEDYLRMIKMSATSVQITNPKCRIVIQSPIELSWHLKASLPFEFFLQNIPAHLEAYPYAKQRAWCNAAICRHAFDDEAGFIFVDIDTLFIGNATKPFNFKSWRIAPTLRWPRSHDPQLAYNFGVTYSRRTEFWEYVYNGYNTAHLAKEGELVPNRLAQGRAFAAEMNPLNGAIYNRIVERNHKIQDIIEANARILHFKGHRKEWMESFYNKFFGDKLDEISKH